MLPRPSRKTRLPAAIKICRPDRARRAARARCGAASTSCTTRCCRCRARRRAMRSSGRCASRSWARRASTRAACRRRAPRSAACMPQQLVQAVRLSHSQLCPLRQHVGSVREGDQPHAQLACRCCESALRVACRGGQAPAQGMRSLAARQRAPGARAAARSVTGWAVHEVFPTLTLTLVLHAGILPARLPRAL